MLLDSFSMPLHLPSAIHTKPSAQPRRPHVDTHLSTPSLDSLWHSIPGEARLLGGVVAGLVLARSSRRTILPRRTTQYNQSQKLACTVRRASTPEAMAAALQQTDDMDEEDFRKIFDLAGGGREAVTFNEMTRLEGIDAILDEGAVSLKELLVLWGDENVSKEFMDFCKFYASVLRLYDEFLWKDAVTPEELFDRSDLDDKSSRYTEEELLEDMPTQGQTLSSLGKKQGYTQATRDNAEITKLFREQCDEDNTLTFEALKNISEIEELLEEQEMTIDELQDFWDDLPKQGSTIDVLAFRDLLTKIDELFEFVEEDGGEEDDLESRLMRPAGEGPQALKDPAQVKEVLLGLMNNLSDVETMSCGLDGLEETDVGVVNCCTALEKAWRNKIDALDEFNLEELEGDWELVYTTSVKLRRWQTVLNGGRRIKNGTLQTLIQNFDLADGDFANEYDMEEVFTTETGEERSFRASGSCNVAVQPNVVSGDDDLVLKVSMQAAEYDTEDDKVETADKNVLDSQMVRTFSYSFLCYIDESLRIMRTGLSNTSYFIFQKLEDVQE